MIFLPEQSPESATVVADRMRRAVEDLAIPHRAKTQPGVLIISADIAALLPEEDKDVETLLKEADAALYNAKESGRNCIVFY